MMAPISQGMNIEEIERIGRSLQQTHAVRLSDAAAEIERLVTTTTIFWMGPDAERFRSWWPEKRQRILAMAEDLRGFGQSALNNASEQRQASGVGVLGAGSPSPRTPPLSGDPNSVAKWWADLSQAERQSLIASDPHRYGSLDGVALADRYAANRLYIASLLEAGGLSDARRTALQRILSDDQAKVLFLDTAGDGRIAVVYGDLQTADDIAIVVPGIGNDLDNFSGVDAWRLKRAAGEDTATIQWLGYDSPSGMWPPQPDTLAMVPNSRAREWAPALDSFVSTVRSYGQGEVTVVAHSYGSIVATEAAKLGMSVERVVLVGSPGVTSASSSVYNGADTYAIRNTNDHVPLLQESLDGGIRNTALGPVAGGAVSFAVESGATSGPVPSGRFDPTSESFGATVLPGDRWGAHSYFGENSNSLKSIVRAVKSSRPAANGMVTQRYVQPDGSAVDLTTGTY